MGQEVRYFKFFFMSMFTKISKKKVTTVALDPSYETQSTTSDWHMDISNS